MDNFKFEFAFWMGCFVGACAMTAIGLICIMIQQFIAERRDKE